MSNGTFDTSAIARKLKAAGFSEDQAEAVTGVFCDARETDLSALAKADLIATKGELRTEIADARFAILKWVLPAIGFQTIVIVGAIVAVTKGVVEPPRSQKIQFNRRIAALSSVAKATQAA